MPDYCEPIDWKRQCQDQTDLLNKSEGKRRILEATIVAKDKKHTEEKQELRDTINRLAKQIVEISEGRGMVTLAEYERVSEANAKLVLKLEATKKYAEQQRRLAQPRAIDAVIEAPAVLFDGLHEGHA